MVRFFPVGNSANERKRFVVILAFTWIFGLVFGLLTVVSAGPSFFALMRSAPECPVSIVGITVSWFLPFLITAIAVFISRLWLLIPVAFLKAFLQMYVSAGVALTFGSGGWLISVLFLFTDYISCTVLIWIWIRLVLEGRMMMLHRVCAGFVFLVSSYFDYRFVSPFLTNLLS